MKTALIVDDDPQVLSLTKRLLQTAGYEVLTSTNFKDARKQLDIHHPSIVVADVRLGDFNGIQLGILAKDARADVRVVIMSGWDDPVLRQEAAELGATYVQKPFSANELLSALE